jgi:hypothetical protein
MYEQRTVIIDMWTFPEEDWSSVDLTGFEVEARDGHVGTVDEATRAAGASYIVLKTGPWIFGKRVMLPAGVISDVDTEQQKVSVDLTRDQIKSAPEFDESTFHGSEYRNDLETYYRNRPLGPDYGKDDQPTR